MAHFFRSVSFCNELHGFYWLISQQAFWHGNWKFHLWQTCWDSYRLFSKMEIDLHHLDWIQKGGFNAFLQAEDRAWKKHSSTLVVTNCKEITLISASDKNYNTIDFYKTLLFILLLFSQLQENEFSIKYLSNLIRINLDSLGTLMVKIRGSPIADPTVDLWKNGRSRGLIWQLNSWMGRFLCQYWLHKEFVTMYPNNWFIL